MHVDIPLHAPSQVTDAPVALAAGTTLTWPNPQPVFTLKDPRIFGTRFGDYELYHRPLIERILSQAATLPANMRGNGGKKVRDEETWNLPEARLILQRVLLLFCAAQKTTQAHIVDRWANVMDDGDYSTPHSHYDAEQALVYFLDAGEENPAAILDGRFEIIDSRVPFCCSTRPDHPTRGLSPEMAPGTLVLFPAAFLHHVRPYSGRRPRITLAFNVSSGLPPQRPLIDPTQQAGWSFAPV